VSLVLVSEAAPHKKCNECGLALPHSEFHRNAAARDGLQPKCKSCKKRDAALRNRRKAGEIPDYYRIRDANPTNCASCLIRSARRRAKNTGMPFDISLEWAKERIAAGVCEASGVPFCIDATARHLFRPSIDRIDNDPAIGYVLGNVRMVALIVNNARNACNDEDFFIECLLKVADGLAAKRIHAP